MMTVSDYNRFYYQNVVKQKKKSYVCKICGKTFEYYTSKRKMCDDCLENWHEDVAERTKLQKERQIVKAERRTLRDNAIVSLCKTHSQSETARILGLSQSYVNQQLKKIVAKHKKRVVSLKKTRESESI